MALGPFFIGEKVAFTFTIRDKDTDDVIDLSALTNASTSGSQAQVLLRKQGSTINRHSSASEINAYVPTPGTAGTIIYTMPSEWSTAEGGQWDAQIKMNFATGVRMSEKFSIRVEPSL